MATADVLALGTVETTSTSSPHPIERFLMNFCCVSFAAFAAYSLFEQIPSGLHRFHLFPGFLAQWVEKLPYSTFLMFFIPGLAGLLAAIYIEWKKPAPESIAKYQFWTTAVIRYYLAYIFLIYGFAKVFKDQFSSFLSTLDTPVGQLYGIELTWRFFGYSYAYTLFVASSQIISSILFFFRRTTILGAMILLPVISNIVFVNFTHHIPVKLMSSVYLVMTIFLLAQDHRRLKALLWDNKPFGRPEFATVRLSKPLTIVKFALVFGAIALPIADNRANFKEAMTITTPLYGAWDVQSYQVNGETKPESDDSTWRKVYFESDTYVGIRRAGVRAGLYQASLDNAKHTISLNRFGSEKPFFEGSYQLEGNDKLTMDGHSDKNLIHAVLSRAKNTPLPR